MSRSLKARSYERQQRRAGAIELVGAEAELLHPARLDDQRLEAGGDAALLHGGAQLVQSRPSVRGRSRRPRRRGTARSGRRAISRSRRFSICVASC